MFKFCFGSFWYRSEVLICVPLFRKCFCVDRALCNAFGSLRYDQLFSLWAFRV